MLVEAWSYGLLLLWVLMLFKFPSGLYQFSYQF